MASKKEKISLKEWLKENKIYFETIAALLLSIMAVIISYQQVVISQEQTSLLRNQKILVDREIKTKILSYKVEYAQERAKLRNLIQKLDAELFLHNFNIDFVLNMSRKQQLEWIDKLEVYLQPILINQAMIEDIELYYNALAIQTLIMNLRESLRVNIQHNVQSKIERQDFQRLGTHFYYIRVSVLRRGHLWSIDDDRYAPWKDTMWVSEIPIMLKQIDSLKKSIN